jgi:hypothetical protein
VASYLDPEGDHVEVDLFKLKSLSQSVVLGYGTNYELDWIEFHPTTPKPAPSGYRVLDGDGASAVANVWRCVQHSVEGAFCSSIGQAKYGLTWTLNGNDADKGVVATFGAGYGGAVTHLQFLCNWTVEHGEIVFDDVGAFSPSWIFVIHVHSRMFCPNYKAGLRVLSGGSVFLMILLVGVTVYLFVGVLWNLLLRDKIEIPNVELWGEVRLSILTAILFIFTCRKGKTMDRPEPQNPGDLE